MDTLKKKKLKLYLTGLAYIVFTAVIIISATSMFNNFYYESVYVSGESMNPTFVGRGASERFGSDYGVIDKNAGAKRNVKRFQIVTTYYSEADTSYKIKRVLVKPNETFKIVDNDIYIRGEDGYKDPLKLTFKRNGIDDVAEPEIKKNYPETTLGPDQYFLAGDNWLNSYDSFNVGPINYDLLVGVVVKMQGRCTIKDGKVVEKESYADRYFLGVDY